MAQTTASLDNPFQLLINQANNNPAQLQQLYEKHRVTRNEQQRAKILAKEFHGWAVDEILARLDGPRREDGYVDPRNCLVIWARPSPQVRELIDYVQNELKSVAPSLWLMPPENLHTTVLEVAHSLTEAEIEALVKTLQSSPDITPSQIAAYPLTRPSRLIKPMVSFDSAALALSFVPAAGDSLEANVKRDSDADDYTYHHLRRDIWDLVRQTNVPVASRYVVPSAHLTVARFISQEGFTTEDGDGAEKVDRLQVRFLLDKIGEINRTLQSEYWPRDGGIRDGGEWVVGGEGLVIRKGRVWYGGGEDLSLA